MPKIITFVALVAALVFASFATHSQPTAGSQAAEISPFSNQANASPILLASGGGSCDAACRERRRARGNDNNNNGDDTNDNNANDQRSNDFGFPNQDDALFDSRENDNNFDPATADTGTTTDKNAPINTPPADVPALEATTTRLPPPPANVKPKVFLRPISDPIDFARIEQVPIVYEGPIKYDKNTPYIDGGKLILADETEKPLGRLLGGGANSKVYQSNSSTAGVVNKIVYLGRVNKQKPKKETTGNNQNRALTENQEKMVDQDVGRGILKGIKDLDKDNEIPFRVADKVENLIIINAVDNNDNNATIHQFALSRELNLNSPVYTQFDLPITKSDGTSEIRQVIQPLKQDGKPVTVTNAQDRIAYRNPRRLSLEEEETINRVIRYLNSQGIVWTDHKLANLDIVPDQKSATGFTVKFFDFDGFRPVRGPNPLVRGQIARYYQRAYDSATDWNNLNDNLNQVSQHYGHDRFKRDMFDYTVFQNGATQPVKPIEYSSPGANIMRIQYLSLLNNT